MNMDIFIEPLEMINLLLILLFLIVIAVANHYNKKRTQKTLDRIDYLLDEDFKEEEEEEEKVLVRSREK